MLERIEVVNFKSYKGKQTIGPFLPFTSVIGPNGAGKSNLMDAISFVLGVKSHQLRSSQLKDLIYRGGKKYNQDNPDSEQVEDADGTEEPAATSASVTAVYKDQKGQEYLFQRNVTASGSSEYRINGTTMTYAKYNTVLEKHNILVKAKNFLVFQGDVEQVAQQNPKDLSKLIEQISGSGDLKDEYDKLKAAAEKAGENSTAAFNKRKGFNTEIKQFQEQKAEALRFDELREERDQAVIHHLVWKLYHLTQAIDGRQSLIEEQTEKLASMKDEHNQHEMQLKSAKKEHAKAQKDVEKQEKAVKKREREHEEMKPALVEIETRMTHTAKKIKTTSHTLAQVESDRDSRAATIADYNRSLNEARKAAKEQQERTRKASQEKGLALSEDDLREYRELKMQANKKAVAERQKLTTSKREARAKRDTLSSLQDKFDEATTSRGKLSAEKTTLKERERDADGKAKALQADLNRVKKNLADATAERTKANQLQTELNEKLTECLHKLQQAGADKRESEREMKLKDTILNLQNAMPGKVLGRVMDLVRPAQRKYDVAVSVVLGRNIDSIVVDTEQTAVSCIQDMRNARSGIATFLPLDTISAKPVNDKYRNFSHNARLAVDIVNYDRAIEKAVHHVCGNALVCDTVDVAKYVCYDKGQEVKAVTLDGTVFHKTGLITGGAAASAGSRRWDEGQIDGLKRLENSLKVQLADLMKSRPRAHQDDLLVAEINRLENDLSVTKDDLAAVRSRLEGVRSELAVRENEVADLDAKLRKTKEESSQLEQTLRSLQDVINGEESEIFADFCERIGISDIAEYEEKQLRLAEEEGAAGVKFKTQITRLEHQIAFEEQQLATMNERITKLQTTIDNEKAAQETLETEKTQAEEEAEAIEQEIEGMRDSLKELEGEVARRAAASDKVKKSTSKASGVYQKALKDISTWNDGIEKAASERFALYRRAKLEEIDLPLTRQSGPLNAVPIEENLRDMAMDVDADEDGLPRSVPVNEYGLEIDFDELDEDEEKDASEKMEQVLLGDIAKATEEIQKLSPNMKAIEKLDEVEAKLAATDSDFASARREAKSAKDAFSAIRKKRSDLFTKAYEHIAENIDVVYKELTKGKASPMGGVAYLSLEESEEPYLHGIKYHAMPPMKRFRDMEQLSGGEKTMAALALLFAVHSYHPSPFFVLDEVDAALDNTNVGRIAHYVRSRASADFQFVVISLKGAFYEKAQGLCGIWRDVSGGTSRTLTLDLNAYR